ncbi:hypothetical protein Golax_000639 [Gossypium laxum]|uniref:Uncharacterized protein n=1 Tax=Gossypium laxum TaxID=34288 RepID=A0A7J9AUD9_9ROSI|nr:hypothetical protein [Gossypium laxum]
MLSEMEKEMVDLNLKDEEDEMMKLPIDLGLQKFAYELCLVGCFLIAIVIHFPAMKNTLASLWYPLRGV